jgi:DNA repair exonuclease SbcCD nuclease subunit
MKTTCIVIGDPHFKINNVVETNEMTIAIINKIKEFKPDFIVVAGDILDRHEIIHVSPLTRSILFLKELTLLCPVYLIIGNHDRKNNRDFCSEEHPFTSLKLWGKNMKVVDTTYSEIINNLLFTFVPYVEPGRFLEALNLPGFSAYKQNSGNPGNPAIKKKIIIKKKQVAPVALVTAEQPVQPVAPVQPMQPAEINQNKWRKSTAIFAHQEFYGCKMGAVKSIVGDKWSIKNPLVISGHIHEYQEPQANIIYVGTPIQHGFGDQNDKTISYFIFNDGLPDKSLDNSLDKSLDKLPDNSPEDSSLDDSSSFAPMYEHVRIDLNLRKKKIVYLKCEDIEDFETTLSKMDNYDLKLVIKGLSSEIKIAMKHPNIKKWKTKGIKIVFKDIPLDNLNDMTNTNLKNENGVKLRFTEILYNNIKDMDNDNLKEIFKEVFGEINF